MRKDQDCRRVCRHGHIGANDSKIHSAVFHHLGGSASIIGRDQTKPQIIL